MEAMTGPGDDRRGGWITFIVVTFAVAAVVLLVWGATALGDSSYLPDEGTLASTVNFWGWISITWACLLGLAAWLVATASPSAKFVGVILCGTSTIFWFVALPKLPIVAILAIILNSVIIYGVVENCDSGRRSRGVAD